jgi:DNA-directed RNA polymerase subunit K/omega
MAGDERQRKVMMTQAPENRFELVVLAGARAKQLMKGATPRVAADAKPVRLAIQEVVERKVTPIPEVAAEGSE